MDSMVYVLERLVISYLDEFSTSRDDLSTQIFKLRIYFKILDETLHLRSYNNSHI